MYSKDSGKCKTRHLYEPPSAGLFNDEQELHLVVEGWLAFVNRSFFFT